jgi:hypothetical protein
LAPVQRVASGERVETHTSSGSKDGECSTVR